MHSFPEVSARTWSRLLALRGEFRLGPEWLFRGQSRPWVLQSSLERECVRTLGSTKDIGSLELKLMRAFRRRYEGPDRDRVLGDSLYCLSLMQHHGAPTRLLDLTYSFFVAVLFALEGTHDQVTELKCDAEIWCFNGDWCWKEASRIKPAVRPRSHITYDGVRKPPDRNEKSFQATYLRSPFHEFVVTENPYSLNQRATIQQGAYLCPGDVTVPITVNLQALRGWDDKRNMLRIRLRVTRRERAVILQELYRMNVSRATLFPGPDGFASSLKHRLAFGPQM